MTETAPKRPTDDVEARRNPNSRRSMSFGRRLAYNIGRPIAMAIASLLWKSCRIERVIGAEHIERVIDSDHAFVPCYWHRDILVCLMTIREWIDRGFQAGVIISASVDGEVPAKIASSWGAEVIRGSASRTGALAMRDMHDVMKRGTSIITAADGPVGPAYYFKSGVLLTSRIGKAPMLPIGCAADRAWYMDRWDDFMIPKPFARIVIAVGEPYEVPRGTSMEGLEDHRIAMQDAVNSLVKQSKDVLLEKGPSHP